MANKYFEANKRMITKQYTQKHIRNYFQAFGYDESSVILCELCGAIEHYVEIATIKPTVKTLEKLKNN